MKNKIVEGIIFAIIALGLYFTYPSMNEATPEVKVRIEAGE